MELSQNRPRSGPSLDGFKLTLRHAQGERFSSVPGESFDCTQDGLVVPPFEIDSMRVQGLTPLLVFIVQAMACGGSETVVTATSASTLRPHPLCWRSGERC